jgi:predicted secreted protein
MKHSSLALLAALIGITVATDSGAARATPSCRTLVVNGTDGSAVTNGPASIAAKPCDRIKVKFVFETQEPLVYVWRVTRRPTANVLKLVSHGYGRNTSNTGTQIWIYRAVGRGKTSVRFGDFTPSYPHQSAASTYKLTVTVR